MITFSKYLLQLPSRNLNNFLKKARIWDLAFITASVKHSEIQTQYTTEISSAGYSMC